MGVKGLWQLVKPCGKTVSMESLEGKVLAVDVSIWLNKAAKGMRDRHGNQVYNSHLVLMFHRICKLLFYGIKPVFVFDGGVPEIKRRTLKHRQNKRLTAETSKTRTKEAMLQNLLQTKALEAVTGNKSSVKVNTKFDEPDLFELPKMTDDKLNQLTEEDSEEEDDDFTSEEGWLNSLNKDAVQKMFDAPELVDIDSEEFLGLPAEVKHELLTEVKDYHRKRHKYRNAEQKELPEEAGDFSSFQLHNLVKRGKITHQIDHLRKEMNNSLSAEFLEVCTDHFDFKNKIINSKKIASESKERYVLIKNVKLNDQNAKSNEKNVLFHANLDDDYSRFRKREFVKEKEHFQKLERIPAKFDSIKTTNIPISTLLSDDSSDDETPLIKKQKLNPKDIKQTDIVEYMSSCTSSDDDLMILQETKALNNLPDNINIESPTCDMQSKVNVSPNEVLVEQRLVKVEHDDTLKDDDSTPKEDNIVSNILSSELQVKNDSNIDSSLISKQSLNIKLSPETSNSLVKLIEETDQKDKQELFFNPLAIVSPNNSTNEKPYHLISPLQEKQFDFPSPLSENTDVLLQASKNNEFVEKFKADVALKSKGQLVTLEKELQEQQKLLTKDQQKQTRLATTITGEMYQDVQELLQLFGIPFITSPMEAEAQCAYLDYANLTDGSITDDSDIFLFGGQTVYKNIFNQNKNVEVYTLKELENMLYLTRKKLIAVAFLTGSDYTEGISE